jgi:hypothetical protein
MSYEFTKTYHRNDNDFYVEPRWAVRALINNVNFLGHIHDPACGTGTIPQEFERAGGFTVSGCDVANRGYGFAPVNFLSDSNNFYENIVTNPPYNRSEDFIKHGIKQALHRIAILARITFLASQRRFKLFTEFPPEKIVVLSRRPSMPPGGLGIYPEGGKTDYCWIVWNKEYTGPSEICWSL